MVVDTRKAAQVRQVIPVIKQITTKVVPPGIRCLIMIKPNPKSTTRIPAVPNAGVDGIASRSRVIPE